MAAGTEAKKSMFAQVLKPNMHLNGSKGRSAAGQPREQMLQTYPHVLHIHTQ